MFTSKIIATRYLKSFFKLQWFKCYSGKCHTVGLGFKELTMIQLKKFLI